MALYKARFPIMQDFDAVIWFDANERKIAGVRHAYGFGQTKEHYGHLLAYQKGEGLTPPDGYTAPSTRPTERRRCAPRTPTSPSGSRKRSTRGAWDPSA